MNQDLVYTDTKSWFDATTAWMPDTGWYLTVRHTMDINIKKMNSNVAIISLCQLQAPGFDWFMKLEICLYVRQLPMVSSPDKYQSDGNIEATKETLPTQSVGTSGLKIT